ncbi:DUF3293 domain-containing protein [Lysobacter sp. TY2-98]|uniref:DUF3293 domain-containing protein n=1 Tax=Lysobacter sp. TY2-98 TaxID=2290922 RepID=UPI000E1FB978|nr:DUF3293 domain-containing protein [Lysobacter sp. TY2-98]AXK71742.1 DUF3293 domain-containing protein [Lysobacter sp. TY2-98]
MSDHGTHEDATQDDPIELARAFARARYCVEFGETTIELGVGELAAEVEARVPASTYGFITAWNPDAESQPTRDNAASDDALAARLAALGVDARRTWAQAPDGEYREAGWLVAGLDADRADALGREFDQAGILAWLAGEPVRLHMLMPRPPGADLPHVDWIE